MKEIQFDPGQSIDRAIEKLKDAEATNGEPCYGMFNGVKITSSDDVDSAFMKITGNTKAEFDKKQEEEHDKYLAENKKHEESIPELTAQWIDRGKVLLPQKYHADWEACVPIRLGDLYRGMELGCCLNIVEQLNSGCPLSVAKDIFDGQGHSGMSAGLVLSMVSHFCDRGMEFSKFVKSK